MLAALGLWGWATWDKARGVPASLVLGPALLEVAVALAAGLAVAALAWIALGRFVAVRYLALVAVVFAIVLLVPAGLGPSPVGWVLTVLALVVALLTLPHVIAATSSRSRLVAAGVVLAVLVVGGLLYIPRGAGSATASGLTRGANQVGTLTYGSGTDARPEYGQDVQIRTSPVDASGRLGGWGEARTTQWGFGANALPLNARVWYPQDAKNAPLVVLAHGNSSGKTDSEEGFAYLGEHLASHGYVVAAVDQNFLNTGIIDQSAPLTGAMQTRAWLLHEHVKAWPAIAQAGPLKGTVDLSKAVLAGHSRGGEAATIAAASAADQDVDGVVGVVGLAPSRGEPDPPRLSGLHYLLVQGSHDSDVVGFGLDAYDRVDAGDALRAAVYVDGGNHTQLNSRWGRRDLGNGLSQYLLATSTLTSADDERATAAGYVRAFLDAALRADRDQLQALEGAGVKGASTLVRTLVAGPGRAIGPVKAGAAQPIPLRSGPSARTFARLTSADTPVTLTVPGATKGDRIRLELGAVDEAIPGYRLELQDPKGKTLTLTQAQLGPLPAPARTQTATFAPVQPTPLTETVPRTLTITPEMIEEAGLDVAKGARLSLALTGSGTAYVGEVRVDATPAARTPASTTA